MPRTFRYSSLQKFGFYLSYFWYKLILPFEMRDHHLRFFGYELLYTLEKFKRYDSSRPWCGPGDIIRTRFGSWRIRLNTSDAANVSPAFERRDVNRLLRTLGDLLAQKKRVLFLDVGGDIGSYSILAGNHFNDTNLHICIFEPVPDSRMLIEENLEMNGLTARVRLFPFAVFNEDDQNIVIKLAIDAPGSSTLTADCTLKTRDVAVTTKKMDTLLFGEMSQYDAVVIKIDVEGVEQQVLEGMEKILAAGLPVHLMVEDFIKPSIIAWLESHGFSFVTKVTDYNSWWQR